MVTEKGVSNKLVSLRPVKFIISVIAEQGGPFDCRYGLSIENHLGHSIARIFSPPDRFEISEGGTRTVEILLNPNQLGPGDYIIGISILANTPLEQINSAARYDLLSRSFSISVELPDSLSLLGAGFIHSSEWSFDSSTLLSLNKTESP